MTTITINRAIVEQALEAVEHLHRTGDTQVFDLCYAPELIPALRAALAQQAEPVQEPITRLEPVAWRFEARHIDTAFGPAVSLKHPGPEHKYMRNVEPLYTAPPQRKPLTEEDEPVLVVEKEPDYWSGGHFYQGSKPHIDPTKVWSLPIGTKLYTAPPQRTMVPLTEEEINRIDVCIDESTPLKEGKSLFARAIENASWEKNHGQT